MPRFPAHLLPPLAAAFAAATLAACVPEPARQAQGVAAVTVPATPTVATPVDAWVGRWSGPEGTWLEIDGSGGPGRYSVTIRDLDGPRTFAGRATGDGTIAFERDGADLALRPTDGPGTGMKWLADRTACLAVRAGEGWCR